jgi:hypothetical protein
MLRRKCVSPGLAELLLTNGKIERDERSSANGETAFLLLSLSIPWAHHPTLGSQ